MLGEIGYVRGTRSGLALHPVFCEYGDIKLEKFVSLLSCDGPFLGYFGTPDVRNTKGVGFGECYVANDEH